MPTPQNPTDTVRHELACALSALSNAIDSLAAARRHCTRAAGTDTELELVAQVAELVFAVRAPSAGRVAELAARLRGQ